MTIGNLQAKILKIVRLTEILFLMTINDYPFSVLIGVRFTKSFNIVNPAKNSWYPRSVRFVEVLIERRLNVYIKVC